MKLVLVVLVAFWLVADSLAAYYVLPPAQPGVTHYYDPTSASWHRKAWVIVVAPFYGTGAFIVHHTSLPRKHQIKLFGLDPSKY